YKYTNLGAFADIYTLMDSRDGLSRGDIVPNVLKAYEYKGGLYGLPVAFNYELWIANSDVISRDYSLWSVSDFLSFAENMPEGMYLGSRNSSFTDRKVAWYNFFNLLMYNYVDFDSYTCDFSSPEFLQVLELLSSFELNEPYDWENADDETSTQYFLEANRALSEKTALIGYSWLHRFLSFAETPGQYNLLEHDNYTYLIPPSNDGRGRIMTGNCMCYSILSNAKNADGAWDYFCYIMGERYQTSYLQTSDTFTSNKAGYDKKLNKFMEDSRYMVYYRNGGTGVDPDSFELVDGELVYTGDTAEKFGHPLDEANKEYILNVLDSCDVLMDSDDTIQSIANEEVEKYLAGEQTAEQCAEMLQNRVSLYLGEIS
ncbi:MAG: extracellular solute-binding protein, partial [Ruminococcus sp.]|nr:extracellular solute-binding protein [Ruminococcus sp.]